MQDESGISRHLQLSEIQQVPVGFNESIELPLFFLFHTFAEINFLFLLFHFFSIFSVFFLYDVFFISGMFFERVLYIFRKLKVVNK